MTITTAELKAERRRQKLVEAALSKWKTWAKVNGLTHTSIKSGAREIERATKPGVTANRLIREFAARTGAPAITGEPMADQSDVLALRTGLYRQRGNGWFPSDPQYIALGQLARQVADGMTLSVFKQEARRITTLPQSYKRGLLAEVRPAAVITGPTLAELPRPPAIRLGSRSSDDPFPPEWLNIPSVFDRRGIVRQKEARNEPRPQAGELLPAMSGLRDRSPVADAAE